MRRFLRENWIWIAAPVALVAIAVIALLVLGEDAGPSPFVYPLG